VFLLVGIVLLLVLPSQWNVALFAACLALFLGELAFWNRRVRDRRAQTGAETLIGRTATVVSACRPDGQVRLAGEIWEASCQEGADPGDTVVVTARQDLKLVVARPTPA
jgi:membrane protein implicated in regulation of membrane protease activity